jgi:hypothetical protein
MFAMTVNFKVEKEVAIAVPYRAYLRRSTRP